MRPGPLLPDAARSKLISLELGRDAARDAASSANGRLNALPPNADPQMRDRLQHERDKHAGRNNQLTRLISAINQQLSQLRLAPGETLEPVEVEEIDLESGDLGTAIGKTRDQITALKGELSRTRAAPLPRADKVELIEQHVLQLARQARPQIGFVGDRVKINWRGDVCSAEDFVALLAWAAPDELAQALARQLETRPERADALPASDRIKRCAELEALLLEAERREEMLIERAHAHGLDILRRVDASPAAVLSVQVVKAAAAAQATAQVA